MSKQAEIGIIGGSGLYSMPGFEAHEEVRLATPFGDPSDAYIIGSLEGAMSISRIERNDQALRQALEHLDSYVESALRQTQA